MMHRSNYQYSYPPENPFFSEETETNVDPEPAAWPIPNAATMERRQAFRDKIFSDTASHRRVHEESSSSRGTTTATKQHQSGSVWGLDATTMTAPPTVKSRNIVNILFDRQTRGAFALTLSDTRADGSGRPEQRKRDRSPSTVFESPVTGPNPANDDSQNDDTDEAHNRALYDNSAASHHHNPQPQSQQPADEEEESFPVAGTLPQRVVWPLRISKEIRHYMEYLSTVSYHSAFLNHLGGDDALDEMGNRPPSSRAVSTISVAFSPDGQSMASTHGDHTVKISCCTTGRLLQSLDGHPRTPWTVKYHPTDAHIVASGCLGHQVRVWNWMEKTCLQMVRLEFAIISLSFHPSGRLLAVANGTRLHFWGVDHGTTRDIPSNRPSALASVQNRSALLTEMDQRHMLRCVHFPPDGKSLIIGGVNPTNEDPRRRPRGIGGGGGISFYLRLWEFDADVALQPPMEATPQGISVPRRAIANPRTFLPRALLYNDGGFDVSPDGKSLCACAEYWLPEGVNNAMELVHQEEVRYENEQRREDREAERRASSGVNTESKGIPRTGSLNISRGMSPSFSSERLTYVPPCTPTTSQHVTEFIPRTPEPAAHNQPVGLSPPPPPGRRLVAGTRSTAGSQPVPNQTGAPAAAAQSPAANVANRGLSTPPPPPPPPPPPAPGPVVRPPHPLSTVTSTTYPDSYLAKGRYVPHVVTISLDNTRMPHDLELVTKGRPYAAVAKGYQPRMGQLLEACPLDANKASAVTCVKFSPSTDFCLIGYGVREPVMENGNNNANGGNGNNNNGGHFHPVTAVYRVRGGMTQVSTMLSGDDDVNIARFHPDSGYGFVYGTKQGRVRVLSRRPWMFYTNPDDDSQT